MNIRSFLLQPLARHFVVRCILNYIIAFECGVLSILCAHVHTQDTALWRPLWILGMFPKSSSLVSNRAHQLGEQATAKLFPFKSLWQTNYTPCCRRPNSLYLSLLHLLRKNTSIHIFKQAPNSPSNRAPTSVLFGSSKSCISNPESWRRWSCLWSALPTAGHLQIMPFRQRMRCCSLPDS